MENKESILYFVFYISHFKIKLKASVLEQKPKIPPLSSKQHYSTSNLHKQDKLCVIMLDCSPTYFNFITIALLFTLVVKVFFLLWKKKQEII